MGNLKKKMSEFVAGINPKNIISRGEASVHTALVEDKEIGNIKYHLRISPDGQGTLSINGDKVIYLNQTASDLVRLFIEKVPDEEIGRYMTKKYDVPAGEVLQDYAEIKATIDTIVHQRDVCPIAFQGVTPEAAMRSRGVPARMDMALTYRCNNACGHCYVARGRSFPEMNTDAWKRVIQKLRDIGVPHVTLTGGEATLRRTCPISSSARKITTSSAGS